MFDGFFGGLFDFDGNGNLDAFEQTVDAMAFADLMEKEELSDVGLDVSELEYMSDYERREAIEDAGLDPDDFDFDF